MIAQLVAGGAGMLAERFAGRVDDAVLATVVEYAPRWDEILAACAEGPPTLVHNDCRVDNVFFRPDGEPVLIDWQIPARSRGTGDVAYLLGGSLDVDVCAASWEDLLRRYHDRLGVSGYSWEQCLRDYRVSTLYGLAPGIALLGSLEGGDGRGLGETIVERALRHVADVDAFGALRE